MSNCVTANLVLCCLTFICVFDKSVAILCYICDSGSASWESVVPAYGQNQQGCLIHNTAAGLNVYESGCPAFINGEAKQWAGCSVDIFYTNQATHSGAVTRIHRSCYPANQRDGQASGDCKSNIMGPGSVSCYCAGDSCNYYSSTQQIGKLIKPHPESLSKLVHPHYI